MRYYSKDIIIAFIEDISNMNIQEKAEIIRQKGMEGL